MFELEETEELPPIGKNLHKARFLRSLIQNAFQRVAQMENCLKCLNYPGQMMPFGFQGAAGIFFDLNQLGARSVPIQGHDYLDDVLIYFEDY